MTIETVSSILIYGGVVVGLAWSALFMMEIRKLDAQRFKAFEPLLSKSICTSPDEAIARSLAIYDALLDIAGQGDQIIVRRKDGTEEEVTVL